MKLLGLTAFLDFRRSQGKATYYWQWCCCRAQEGCKSSHMGALFALAFPATAMNAQFDFLPSDLLSSHLFVCFFLFKQHFEEWNTKHTFLERQCSDSWEMKVNSRTTHPSILLPQHPPFPNDTKSTGFISSAMIDRGLKSPLISESPSQPSVHTSTHLSFSSSIY